MERIVGLEELIALLQKTPVVVAENPWLRLRLGGQVAVYNSTRDFKEALNRLDPLEDVPTLVFCSDEDLQASEYSILPIVKCAYDPFEDRHFNFVLARRFTEVCQCTGLFVQSKIADYFVRAVDMWQPMFAVLLIVDGLSFVDLPGDGVVPCLVDGVSLTAQGMRRIVGDPHVVERLFEQGFANRVGFSYWERDNELTDHLFWGFTSGQLIKVETFEQVLDYVDARLPRRRTYLQIVRAGLDGYIHSHRDMPPREHLITAIQADIAGLVEKLQRTGERFVLFVTADHGILWASDFPEESVFLNEGRVPIRYYLHDEVPERIRGITVYHPQDGAFSLPITHFRRRLTTTEWGCHGGVSMAESFVPLLRIFG